MSTETGGGGLAYPQSKLLIEARYFAPKLGDHVPEGHPETVRVEVNAGLPADPAELDVFIRHIIEALMHRTVGVAGTADVRIEDPRVAGTADVRIEDPRVVNAA
jgi:hypothetical protein